LVVAPAEKQPAEEVVLAVPPPVAEPVEEQPVQEQPVLEQPTLEVASLVPPEVEQPVVLEQPKSLETAASPKFYLYFYTGVPVRTVPSNVVYTGVVSIPTTQNFAGPVFMPLIPPVQVRTFQFVYSTGFAYSTHTVAAPVVYYPIQTVRWFPL
jgi:hypothetical protein